MWPFRLFTKNAEPSPVPPTVLDSTPLPRVEAVESKKEVHRYPSQRAKRRSLREIEESLTDDILRDFAYDPDTGTFYRISTNREVGYAASPTTILRVHLGGTSVRGDRLAHRLVLGVWPEEDAFALFVDGDIGNLRWDNLDFGYVFEDDATVEEVEEEEDDDDFSLLPFEEESPSVRNKRELFEGIADANLRKEARALFKYINISGGNRYRVRVPYIDDDGVRGYPDEDTFEDANSPERALLMAIAYRNHCVRKYGDRVHSAPPPPPPSPTPPPSGKKKSKPPYVRQTDHLRELVNSMIPDGGYTKVTVENAREAAKYCLDVQKL